MQLTRDESDAELIALAEETERLADATPDLGTASRLREIATEVRKMAGGAVSL